MLIVGHLGTPNSDFNGCHCMRDPVLYRSMGSTLNRGMHSHQIKLNVHGMCWPW